MTVFPPQKGEIWWVEDSEVTMHPDGRQYKKKRPVLIVSSNLFNKVKEFPFVHIIPLSRQAEVDELIIPIQRGFIETSNGFKPDKDSCAIVPFIQPIERRFIKERCGKIEEDIFYAILSTLFVKVFNYNSYDLNID
ncbi:MAG: type II toxin-antitoxin system PemK/MazF family toxin [Ignavibacteriaceae bacterium]|nr:type II toxin-antitoxin system PemK/MazF family toxin [Ignavibacteriaceae bacterium]